MTRNLSDWGKGGEPSVNVIDSDMGNGGRDVGKRKCGLIKLNMMRDKKFIGGEIKTLEGTLIS